MISSAVIEVTTSADQSTIGYTEISTRWFAGKFIRTIIMSTSVSLFDEHNLVLAAKRIAAAKDVDDIDVADARVVRKALDEVIAAEEKKSGAEARRMARLKAAAESESMRPIVTYAEGSLRRLGLDFHAAADMNKLNAALTAANWDTTKRIEIKRLLAEIGVID
jgi:hypothetical protein